MASYPARNHTKRGVAQALHGTYCEKVGQPDPGCDCCACNQWFAGQQESTQDLTRGAQ